MRKILNVLRISFYHVKQWKSNPKIYAIIIIMFIFMYSYVKPISDFIKMVGVQATPFLYPFLFTDQFLLMLLMLGIIILFCDAPFFDNAQLFIAIRCGKTIWACGQIVYIILTSIVYFVIVYLMSVLLLLPNITMQSSWGKIWNTLSQTDAASSYEIYLSLPYKIIVEYTPIEAVFTVFYIGILISVFIGLLLFFLNIYINKAISIAVTTGFVLITTRVAFLPAIVRYFCPVSWINLNLVSKTYRGTELFVGNVTMALLIINSILVILCIIGIRRVDLG